MNDWLVANINNPDFDVVDFKNIADMTIDNTQMLSRNEYLKSNYIKNNPIFQDSEGNFSDKLFNQYYDDKLKTFQHFSEGDYLDVPEVDMFDTHRTGRVRDDGFRIGRSYNPERRKIGIEGFNVISEADKSPQELAQESMIWDSKKQEYLTYSPNDIAFTNNPVEFVKSLFQDPLVMAQYEEDGFHQDPITKQQVKHKKGDYKLNDKGTFYYETLSGKSPLNKELLVFTDYLTPESSWINEYDFFDSDDVEKSISGVVFKTAATVAPLFLGKKISNIYSALLVGKELAKTVPLLYEIVTGFQGKETPEYLNNLVSFSYRSTQGVSQHSKYNTFTFENIGNLIGDVATQYGQQRLISKSFNSLRGTNKYVENAEKNAFNLYKAKKATMGASGSIDDINWKNTALGQACIEKFVPKAQELAVKHSQLGRDLSMLYMAMTSNSDVYSDALSRGATKAEAAAVALGSTLGMFAFDRFTGLGELFFDDATGDAIKQSRIAIRNEINKMSATFKSIANSNKSQTDKYLGYMKTASATTKKFLDNYSDDLRFHTTGLMGKALGEGLEEVGEELITDISKSLYELAGKFGYTSVQDLGAWENILDRYAMSFIGGGIGGGVFYARGALQGEITKPSDIELETLIRQGYLPQILQEVERLEKSGKLGNTRLSGTKFEQVGGDKIWLTAQDKQDSQNHIAAQLIRDKIISINTVINNNRANLTDDQLFEQMVLSWDRFRKYQDISGVTNYYQDYANTLGDLVQADLNLKKAKETVDGTLTGTLLGDTNLTEELKEQRSKNLKVFEEKQKQAKDKFDSFISGDNSLMYSRKLNFAMDKNLHTPFVVVDEDQLWKQNFPNKIRSESPNENAEFEAIILPNFIQNQIKTNLSGAWDKFLEWEQIIHPHLQTLADPKFKDWSIKLEPRLSKLRIQPIVNKLEDDPEDLGTLTEEQKQERNQKLKDLQTQQNVEWVNEVRNLIQEVGGMVDPISARNIKKLITTKLNRFIDSKFENPKVKQIVRNLKGDLSNSEEILQLIQNYLINSNKNDFREVLAQEINKLLTQTDIMSTMSPDSTIGEIDENLFSDINIAIIKQVLGDDFEIYELESIPDLELEQGFEEAVNLYIQPQLNTIQSAFSDLKNDPVLSLYAELNNTLKNPLIEVIKSLEGVVFDGKTIQSIEEILNKLTDQNLFDEDPIILNENQSKMFQTTKDILQLIQTYLYAASSKSNMFTPIGHNKMFNEFAKNNSKLISNWDELPEIDMDYSAVYLQQAQSYINELDILIRVSLENRINKQKQFELADKNFITSWIDFISNNKQQFVIDIDDKTFNLLEGATFSDDNFIYLYNLEKTIYNNIQKISEQTELSVIDILKKSKFLDKFIPDKSFIWKQKRSAINSSTTHNTLTDYDKLRHLTLVLSQDPAIFYSGLLERVKNNVDIAPIITQEYGTRVTQAATTKQFRDIWNYFTEDCEIDQPRLPNTVICFGDGGSGKTQTQAKPAAELYKSEEVLAVGPTEQQVGNLKQSAKIVNGQTIDQLMTSLLGEEQFTKVKNSLETYNYSSQNEAGTEFFNISQDPTGVLLCTLKPESIKLNDIPYRLIVIDEATFIPSLYSQIIALAMQQNDGLQLLLGDPKQKGFHGLKSGIGNIDTSDVFAVRTPDLTISLRDNNIQKQENLEKLKTLVSQMLENYKDLSWKQYEEYVGNLPNVYKKLNFSVYNEVNDINGDLIVPILNSTTLNKIKGKSVAFVGSKNSAAYKTIQETFPGQDIKQYSVSEIQGQEFDYVIIDHNFGNPKTAEEISDFLQTLYMLMSRGRIASIFIDNGLSNLIGENINSLYQAFAPNIKDKVNGVSIIDKLRETKLELLRKLDLTKTEGVIIKSDEDDLNDPDEDDKVPEPLKKLEKPVKAINDSEIPVFTDITYLGAKLNPKVTRKVKDKTYKYDELEVVVPKEGPLRNLQALVPNGKKAYFYEEKKQLEATLFKAKSFIQFNHSWDDKHIGTNDDLIPYAIRENFSKDSWEKGTFEIEIRNTKDEISPMFSGLQVKETSINLVFKVLNKEGRECIFDLGGINDPIKYEQYIEDVKKNADESKKKILEKQVIDYKNLISAWMTQYENTGEFSLNVGDVINFSKCTWFEKRKAPIRLSGRLNPNTMKFDIENAKAMNPGFVFSDVYTYANKDLKALSKIDPSIRGKAVVFVSSDSLLSSDELIRYYINQKQYPETNTPVVRMLVLDNYGLSLSQYIKDGFFEEFGVNHEDVRTPVRNNFLGVQMFTAMWNFKTALQEFTDLLDNWASSNNYSEDKISSIIEAQELIRLGKKTLDDYTNVTKQDLDNLTKFNQEVCSKLPTFRLGYSTNNNGFHIQQCKTVEGLYDGTTTPDLIYITPNKANQFKELLTDILKSVTTNGYNLGDVNTLSLSITGKQHQEIKGYIDLEQSAHKRTLSKMLKFDSNTKVIKITDDQGNQVAFTEGQEWSMLPRLITNLLRKVYRDINNPEDVVENLDSQSAKLKITQNDQDKLVEIPVGNWYSNGLIEYQKGDKSLFDLFDLMLHGTVEDIHKKLKKGERLAQYTGARYKKGIFVNPDVSRKKNRTTDNEIENISDSNGKTMFYVINTPGEFFTLDVDLRHAPINLNISELLNLDKQSKETPPVQEEQQPEQSKNSFIEAVQEINPEVRTEEDAINVCNAQAIKSLHNALLMKGMDYFNEFKQVGISQEYGDTTYKFDINTLNTLLDDDIESIEIIDDKIFYIGNNSKYQLIIDDDFYIDIIKSSSIPETQQDDLNTIMKDINEDSTNEVKAKAIKRIFDVIFNNSDEQDEISELYIQDLVENGVIDENEDKDIESEWQNIKNIFDNTTNPDDIINNIKLLGEDPYGLLSFISIINNNLAQILEMC